ncbi:hypothetical protein D3C72_1263730 [compost metagenome]
MCKVQQSIHCFFRESVFTGYRISLWEHDPGNRNPADGQFARNRHGEHIHANNQPAVAWLHIMHIGHHLCGPD